MKFLNYLLATATLAGLSASTPAPVAEAASALEKRDNAARCTLINCGGGDQNGNAEVYIDTWGYWSNDWGSRLLKHLRNQCGGNSAIYGWEFGYDGGNNANPGHAHFWAYTGNLCKYNNACGPGINHQCSSHCVEDAIWLASQESGTGAIGGVNCELRF